MTRWSVPATPDVLATVREELRTQMFSLGMDGRTDDVLIAVNEAVSSSVRHAYPDSDGDIEIVTEPTPNGITIMVCDTGRGPGDWRGTAGAGFGTAIMARLADTLAINGQPGGGTEVRLEFRR